MDYRDEGAALALRIANLEEALVPLREARAALDEVGADRAARRAALRAAEAQEAALLSDIAERTRRMETEMAAVRGAVTEARAGAERGGFTRRHFFVVCLGLSPLVGACLLIGDGGPLIALAGAAVVIVVGLVGLSGWAGEGL
jgi:hypothetical protein